MAISNISQIGQSGLKAAKAGIATAGHNIANASTEGYSRQRVITDPTLPGSSSFGHNFFGNGTEVSRVERVNDEFVEKQIRNSNRELSHFEEKSMALNQIEEVFNEMGGDGLNRLVSKFFNEFRQLSTGPENIGLKSAVREAGRSLTQEFHRLQKQIVEIRDHLDARIQTSVTEANALAKDVAELNDKIRLQELNNGPPNDLLDKRDSVIKKLSAYMELSAFKDNSGGVNLDIRGVGPLVAGSRSETIQAIRTLSDGQGKEDGMLDISSSGSAHGRITHQIQGGKLGALLEARDQVISSVLGRLDEMAFAVAQSVNGIHSQGYTQSGITDVDFFEPVELKGASGSIQLSDEILSDASKIVTAAEPDSPGDNRIALAISGLQAQKILGDDHSTIDEWYNSIVSDIGSQSSHTQFALSRERDIVTQLGRVRDQISGVSVDEETTRLLEFQHTFEASAKIIQLADEMFKTILSLKRD